MISFLGEEKVHDLLGRTAASTFSIRVVRDAYGGNERGSDATAGLAGLFGKFPSLASSEEKDDGTI